MDLLKKTLKYLTIAITLIAVIFVIHTLLKKPSLNKNWEDDSSVLPRIVLNKDILNIKGLRDYEYEDGKIIGKNYIDEEFDITKVSQMYFLVNPFKDSSLTAHTFFGFDFSDGKSLSISVEARKEKEQKYSAFKGLFNNYELWIAWGTQNDFETRRTKYFKEDLYKYPILVSTSTMQLVLEDMALQTIKIYSEPEFYNTFFSNCTNYLADSANRVNKGSIPWSMSRVLTGLAPKYLYDLGFIPNDMPFEKIMEKYKVNL